MATQSKTPQILGPNGLPLRAATYHSGADRTSRELASWNPGRASADAELLPELNTLQARTQDIIRNHGITSGAVQVHLDNIIGSGLRLSAKPDWRALGVTDREAAAEWERTTESQFRQWADDVDCYCDASRRLKFAGLLSQSYRSYLTAFEALATVEWLPNRGGAYATAIQTIDPMRLENPWGRSDSDRLRAGVELDAMGAPVAYWIVSSLVSDVNMGSMARTWKRVPRETPWGRQQVLHVYDVDRAGQSRGKNGIVSVLAKLKMLEKFEQATLQAAILNAMYAAVIQSSLDWSAVSSAIGGNADTDPTLNYLEQIKTFHQDGNIRYDGIRVPHLYPGEEFKLLTPQHPSAAFAQFEEATLRHIAAGLNLTYEQLSRDYSKTNYSSARAAMLESWKFFGNKRTFVAGRFATLVYSAWLEEAFDRGDVTAPAGAPDFLDAKTAWTRSQWIGPGRGHIDPQKEMAAIETKIKLGLTTLEKEAAEQGDDWEELMEQRAQEALRQQKIEEEYGVSLSSAGGATAAPTTTDTPNDPEREPNDAREDEPGAEPQDGEQRTAPDNSEQPQENARAARRRTAQAGTVVVMEGAKPPYADFLAMFTQLEDRMINRMMAQFKEIGDRSNANLESVMQFVSETLSAPVRPIYDDHGRLIGARRELGDQSDRLSQMDPSVRNAAGGVIRTVSVPVRPRFTKEGALHSAQRDDRTDER